MENRRDFLKRTALLATAMPFVINCKDAAIETQPGILSLIKKNAIRSPECNWCGANGAPSDVKWKTSLTKKGDEGQPILISGTVFQFDGATPAPNILIYVYHTDVKGFYGRGRGDDPHGKHHGWMLTDAQGKYEFRSIKPGQYPLRDTPAHIHFTLTGVDFKEDWIDDIWFAGDDLITPEITRRQMNGKGGFNSILKLEKAADGVLCGRRDIRLWRT